MSLWPIIYCYHCLVYSSDPSENVGGLMYVFRATVMQFFLLLEVPKYCYLVESFLFGFLSFVVRDITKISSCILRLLCREKCFYQRPNRITRVRFKQRPLFQSRSPSMRRSCPLDSMPCPNNLRSFCLT